MGAMNNIKNNETTDQLICELYARFGLAYYYSEVLHRGLSIVLALIDLPHKNMITGQRIEERLAYATSLTLGEIVNELSGKLPEDYSEKLFEVRDKRNFLAHHFWYDRAHLLFNSDDVNRLIDELNGYAKLFVQLDQEVTGWFEVRRPDMGLTVDQFQDSLSRVLAGKEEQNPLPPKEVIRERENMLKRVQRLVRVWEFDLHGGSKPLVFEFQNGSLWQLCDVGLGWTKFQNVESNWDQQPLISQYLPADITPRPKNCKPWEYEFKLKNSTILWVKPGKRPKTFRWGITKGHQS